MVRFSLRELSRDISRTLDKGNGQRIDFATRAHLTEVQSRIDRALNSPIVAPGTSGSRIGMERE
jgi:hypothetical protein